MGEYLVTITIGIIVSVLLLSGLAGVCYWRVCVRVKAHDKDIRDIRMATKKQIDGLSGEIRDIREDYITKDDFFREQAKTERKLDRILDILLNGKGGSAHG